MVPGPNISPEGFGKSFDYGFVMDFKTKEDAHYYAEIDPAHLAVKKVLGAVADDLFVYDIEG